MRLNKYLALYANLSRRSADKAIETGRVVINNQPAKLGQSVEPDDIVTLDSSVITPHVNTTTILLNKPVGYVCSRAGQGSKTVYDLLPKKLHNLKPVGRLDKDSSGLLLLTNDGKLANRLAHPRYQKTKVYKITLNKPLEPLHKQMINDHGIKLEDGISRLTLEKLSENRADWRITMSEGRNRQIRRTFAALGYKIGTLNRIQFGNYKIDKLLPGNYIKV